MNIKVTLTNEPNFSALTGGGCAATDCYINIDAKMDDYLQTEVVLHEILEAFLPFMCHEKVEELTDLLMDGLTQLGRSKVGEE